MDLSIIIVNYNTREFLYKTISSIYVNIKDIQVEIIVSDNGSSDGSKEYIKAQFEKLIWISNNENLGFSKANNIAIKKAKGRYILILNSDTAIIDDCLNKCKEYMDKFSNVGALGCKVVLPNGSLDLACRRSFPTPEVSFYRMTNLSKLFPKSKVFGKYNLTYLDEDKVYEVDSIVGAFMMLRREVVDQVGLLDEDFFMYGEDVDWCYRIKQAGWKIMYYPKAKIIHYKGGSTDKRNPKLIYEFYRAMILFYDKHYKSKYPIFVTLFIYIGIYLKLGISLALNEVKGLIRGDRR